MSLFSQQVVLVTGGSQGIGNYIAHRFASDGAKVVIASRTDGGSKAASSTRAQGMDITWMKADVSVPSECEDLVKEVVGKFQRIDVLINNAGNKPEALDRSIQSLVNADLDFALAPHLSGPFNLCVSAWAYMSAQGYGRILNFSSGHVFGSTRDHGLLPFAIAKAGIIGLTKHLALAGRQSGIFVNALFPAALDSNWNRVGWHSVSQEDEQDLADVCSKVHIWPFVKWVCSENVSCNGEMFSVCNDNITRVFLGDTKNISRTDYDTMEECIRAVMSSSEYYTPKSIGHFFGNHLGPERSRLLGRLLAKLKATSR